jgi:hypothetical protein
MRALAPIAAIAALALITACSRSDEHRADADAKSAGQSVAHNPEVRQAQADLKQMGHTAAKEFHKLAAEAKVEAHKLAADTRGAAHDVTRHDRPDDRGGDHSSAPG